MGFNDQLGMAGSWYAATATPTIARTPLTEDIDVDVAVVGAGCTGLSAALHLAQRGLSVAVLEGGRIGWGASGRNGGQMIPGLRQSAVDLVARLGPDRARALLGLAFEAHDLVVDLVERHAIDCDLRLTGHLLMAAKAHDLAWMRSEADCLAEVIGYRHCEVLDAGEAAAEVAAPYHGALLDRLGGHLHPLNYTLGLARAAEAAGAKIFEGTPVTALVAAGTPTLSTPRATVRAGKVVLAGDALMQGLAPAVERRIMPVANYIAATEPLADPAAIIANDRAVSDSRFVVNYYRLSRDGRLLFGGGERYTPAPPLDMAAFVRGHLERTFPQLRGVRIDHAWGGLVSITRTRLPHIGRRGEVLFAHGYSGQGVLLTTLAGALLAEAIAGQSGRFDRFADLAPDPFPGGPALRAPLHVLGMLWYAMRDRL